jgi:hypothetical protein
MQILFVDESGTPPPPNRVQDTPYFVLGGVVIPEDVWGKMAKELDRIKTTYKVDGEIKWRYFANDRGNKPTPLSHLSTTQKEELRNEMYEVISAFKSVKIISVVTNVTEAYALPNVKTADDLYWLSYKQLTERFQYYLQDLERIIGHKVHGIIVCDHRGPQDDARLRELHHALLNSPNSHTALYGNLVEGLFIAPSHLSVGIQFADMVAGAIFRCYKAKDERFYKKIEGSIRTSPTGRIDGYGVVKFPKGNW